jgi:predicted Rossmann fold flavoprotein
MKIGIIGAGPSGLTSGISIKRHHPNYDITIIERLDKKNTKLLVSGNGRCNLGNTKLDKSYFNHPSFMEKYITRDNYKKFINFLEQDLGLILVEKNDLLYPNTFSSNTVDLAYSYKINDLGINIIYNEEVNGIEETTKGVSLRTKSNNYLFDKVIVAIGGKSFYKNAFNPVNLFNDLKITYCSLNPVLTGFKLNTNVKFIFGVKTIAKVSVYDGVGHLSYQETGEIGFKEDGISGICIMNSSSIYAWNNKKGKIFVDFFPNLTYEELNLKTKGSFHNLRLIMNTKLVDFFKKNNIPISSLKNYELDIAGVYGFDYCQVTNGGICLNELNEDFSLVSNNKIYAIGEVLDIDGLCGGNNLYHCILEGILIGESI